LRELLERVAKLILDINIDYIFILDYVKVWRQGVGLTSVEDVNRTIFRREKALSGGVH
jgi:hypothetical protein